MSEESPTLPAHLGEAARDPANVIGKYVRVQKLGAGGMGEVWKAWDPDLRRWVALKLLRTESDEDLARFKREAQTAAKLGHPNIAAIYEVGDSAGRPFIAMQFVDGRTIQKLPNADRRAPVRLMRDAALAIQHAHDQGVVHRDLKPHNIMVEGERVYVLDFGLAKQRAVGASLSVSGQVVGTPSYMPPEQARGQGAAIGPRSDVYSLGATLYELLAGRPPFTGTDPYEVMRKVIEEDPPSLRRLNPAVGRDLETIAMKCLDKEPRRRYASARELADDLTRWLDGEAISAMRTSVFYRVRKRLAKRKALVAVAAVAIAALAGGAALLVPKLGRAERALELWTRISGLLGEAELCARQGNVEEARRRLDRAMKECAASPDAHARFFAGRILFERGDLAKAEAELTRAIELDPQLGEARLTRGLVRVERLADEALRLRITRLGVDARRATHPELAPLREAAAGDLRARIGRSSYFREVDALFGRAMLLVAEGRDADAVPVLGDVLKREPLYVEAQVELARIADRDGRHAEAVEAASAAVAQHRGLASAYVARAHARHRLGDPAGVRDDAAAALAIDPLDSVRTLYAYALEALGDVAGALRALDEGMRLRPDDPFVTMSRGYMRMLAGDGRGAIEDLDRAIQLAPRNKVAFLNRGVAREKLGDGVLARADFDAAIGIDPEYDSAYHNRGNLRRRQGDVAGALADYERGLQADPRSHEILISRALLRAEQGETAQALRDLDQAVRIAPRYAPGLVNRGALRHAAGDEPGAVADFTQAIEADPRCALAYANRSEIHAANGQADEALRDAEKAVELDPKEALSWLQRANARIIGGDAEGAIADWGRAIELNPRLCPAHLNRGIVWMQRREYPRAQADFEAVLRIDPRFREAYKAHVNLGSMRAVNDDPKGALEHYAAAIELNPKYPTVYYLRGRVRAQMGDTAAAVEDWEAALRFAPPGWPHRKDVEALLKR